MDQRPGELSPQTYARWTCGYCTKTYVVPSLARDCEKRHENVA